MASLPPRRTTTPTKSSKQHLTPLQTLLQMGFAKHRAEKALAATGHKGIQASTDWLLAHVNDPLLDDNSPREYILYACPTGPFLQQLQIFWEKSKEICGWNGAHNFTPHVTLVSFFKAPDEDSLHLAQGLQSVMERQGAKLDEPLKLETYTSPNFMGFFVAEEHADYLKRIAMQYVKEVSNAIISDTYEHFDALTACFPWCTTTTARCIPRGSRSISLEPHVKSLHLTLAYQFPSSQYTSLKSLVDELEPGMFATWELRLYSRDPHVNGKQVYKVKYSYTAVECDELDLRFEDYIYVNSEAISGSSDGWIEGNSWQTGQSGLLPSGYIERAAESDLWTLHEQIPLNENPSGRKGSPKRISLISKQSSVGGSEMEENGPLETNKEAYNSENSRSIFIMRHGERVDFVFGTWIPHCFDEQGIYTRIDLNMPLSIPKRSSGPEGFLLDAPLTNVGYYSAKLIGENLKQNGVKIDHVYSSPSFRCVQTSDAVLRGLGVRENIKIRVDPGLYEWISWYTEIMPDWLSLNELKSAGYNVDMNYMPYVNEKELKESKENCEQFYLRKAFVVREVLGVHLTGNILIVGHSSSLETCSHELLGRKPRHADEMMKTLQKIPYCSFLHLKCVENKWDIAEPPGLPSITHSSNQSFNWKVLTNI